MATLKTESTELSVSFGLLDMNPLEIKTNEISSYFDGTLTIEKYNQYRANYEKNTDYYERFVNIGRIIRHSKSRFARARVVRWEGPRQQAKTSSMAKDVVIENTSISVKAKSDVVFNFSLYKLFVAIPTGAASPSRSQNWYYTCSPEKYQAYYTFVRNKLRPEYPELVDEYQKQINSKDRKLLAKEINELSDEDAKIAQELYLDFCRDVAQVSANKFNDSLQESLNSGIKSTVIENIISNFFRIGDNEYILCGLDGSKEFAITIPDLTSWKREWRFKELKAIPDLKRKQSVVLFDLTLVNKKTSKEHIFKCEVQIRWGHGKLNGNPEAKFYKKFQWNELPFIEPIIKDERFKEFKIIDEGSFGIVYQAKDIQTDELVAIKKLKPEQFEAATRFKREIRIQLNLEHRNILPIIYSEETEPLPWFAMPLAVSNLHEQIEKLQNNFPKINHIFMQVLHGIQYAHAQDIIHRDLKPENILLFTDDQVKISDFGIGKHLGSANEVTFMTSSSETMGSIFYAAPEQLESFSTSDKRVDIYSLGKILYSMVTASHIQSWTIDTDKIPNQYKDIIMRCIEEDPDKRFGSVDMFLQAFERVAHLTAAK